MRLGKYLDFSVKSKTGNRVAFLPFPPIGDATDSVKGVTLPFYFIGLASRLATCDGSVNRKETEAFLDLFSPEIYFSDEIQQLFVAAGNDNMDEVYYARRIVRFFPDNTDLYRHMFLNLLHIAVADAPLSSQEIKLLKKITAIFHLTDAEIDGMLKQYATPIHSIRRRILPLEILKAAFHRIRM